MLLRYGFRTFFSLAGLWATLAAVLWAVALGAPGSLSVDVGWHAREMVFGFAGALIAGFVLTAVPNWTKTERVHGWPLLVLALLWLAGRVGGLVPAPAIAGPLLVAGALFFFGLALAVGIPIVRTRNLRNFGVLGILGALGALSAAAHLSASGHITVDPSMPSRVAVFAIVILLAVVGGRVTPLFTRNKLKAIGAKVRARSFVDDVALLTLLAACGTSAATSALSLATAPELLGALWLVAAGSNAARMLGWGSTAARADPLLFVLHAGYAWLWLGAALLGMAYLFPADLAPATALHALTVGALGSYAIGMMSRVSLGHTGRPLVAPRAIVLGYFLVGLAGAVRVFGPLMGQTSPSLHVFTLLLWAFAYATFVALYLPILVAPRADGKAG
jgi:uncharacterized protein involved in response to NO